jgi:hypothetical protein
MRNARWGWLFLLCLPLGGCPQETTPSDVVDDGGTGDVEDTDDGGGEADAEPDDAADVGDGGPPPVAPASEPVVVPITEWMVASVAPVYGDAVETAVRDGSFTYPAEGTDPATGIRWYRRIPDENGVIGSFSGGNIIYAAARFTLDAPGRAFARTGRTWGVYANGVLQPGDIYASGRMRVPLRTHEGENLVVLQAASIGADVDAQIYTTPDEAFLNADDPTAPEFVVGDSGELPLGIPLLNLTGAPAADVTVRVVESDEFEATESTFPGLAATSATQVGFLLRPKAAFAEAGLSVPVRLHVESPSWGWAYERELTVTTVAAEGVRRRTFVSPDDGSVQFYGVLPPSSFDPTADYALVLSTHGAGVEAGGQAAAYSARDWNYVVAPTNRRPFGFDWEEWGRLNALYALDDAIATYNIDPTRVYLTGHSMGGHGTWHVGVTTPGRFATLGPSAGWSSFYSYTGDSRPTGTLGRARAHSDTNVYLSNLAHRGVYIIHGSADDNVPVREGRDMYAAVQLVTTDVVYHEEPGAGHWWDGDAAPGADCVDWPPLFDFMQAHTLDPVELDFDFMSESPAYSPTHSFVTIESAETPMDDVRVVSTHAGDTVTLTTTNVRSLTLDGTALGGRGVATAVVDGTSYEVADGPIAVGPTTGKRHDVYGTFNQAYRRPFCFVHPDEDGLNAQYAAYLASSWTIIGNGHSCAVPFSRLTPELRAQYNMIYVGIPVEALPPELSSQVGWNATGARVGGESFGGGSVAFVYPEGDRLSAVYASPAGREWNLFDVVPFSSRSGLPDYFVWRSGSRLAAGFFNADWAFSASFADP